MSSLDNVGLPSKVVNIKFEGVKKTRPRILSRIVADIFPATSRSDILTRIVLVQEKLHKLGAFRDIEVRVDQLEAKDSENYEVTFVVEEKSRLAGGIQTAVDAQSTHLSLQLSSPNLNGVGDSIKIIGKLNKSLHSGQVIYSVPVLPWRTLWAPEYSLSVGQYTWGSQPSGFDQDDKSINNRVVFFSLPLLKHTIILENVWRHIKSSGPGTPIQIREQCGHSLKNSIEHTLTYDSRVGGSFPYHGILAKLTNQFTTNLVANAAKFTRHEVNLQLNSVLVPKYDITCQTNLHAGTLLQATRVNICDKFFAGGPLTLRGFKFQGLAPNTHGYPIGAESYLSAGTHIYSKLPFTSSGSPINDFIRPHIFFNTGTIGNVNEIWRTQNLDDVKGNLVRFRESLRSSWGFGLVLNVFRVRFELNYCIPLRFSSNDLMEKGIQWGFGMEYT